MWMRFAIEVGNCYNINDNENCLVDEGEETNLLVFPRGTLRKGPFCLRYR